jgi:hypothetical protein
VGFIGKAHDKAVQTYVSSISRELDLVYLDTGSDLQAMNAFAIFPSVDIVCQAFANLIFFFKFKHAAILYNTKTSNFFSLKAYCLISR